NISQQPKRYTPKTPGGSSALRLYCLLISMNQTYLYASSCRYRYLTLTRLLRFTSLNEPVTMALL
ncbi:hypothetical protein L9F63_027244, partial [Diploptera punctata]